MFPVNILTQVEWWNINLICSAQRMQQNTRPQLKVPRLQEVEAGYETWGMMLTEVFCPHLCFFTTILSVLEGYILQCPPQPVYEQDVHCKV